MERTDSLTMFINEAAAGDEVGDVERNVGTLDGVLAVEVGPAEEQGDGDGPAMLKRAEITYDAARTDSVTLRSDLEGLGYAVTVLGDLGT